MPIVKNILQLPTAPPSISALRPRSSTTSVNHGNNIRGILSGSISNGHLSVFANIANQGQNKATIKFKIAVDGIDTVNYKRWQIMLNRILGARALNRIHGYLHDRITEEFGPQPQLNDDHLLAYYSLEVMSYVYPLANSDSTYLNQSNQPFSSSSCSKQDCKQVLASIHSLPITKIHMQGELTVDNSDPVENAFIPITYFDFTQAGNLPGRLVPFVGFPGSVVLLTKSKREIVSKPGLLKAVGR